MKWLSSKLQLCLKSAPSDSEGIRAESRQERMLHSVFGINFLQIESQDITHLIFSRQVFANRKLVWGSSRYLWPCHLIWNSCNMTLEGRCLTHLYSRASHILSMIPTAGSLCTNLHISELWRLRWRVEHILAQLPPYLILPIEKKRWFWHRCLCAWCIVGQYSETPDGCLWFSTVL